VKDRAATEENEYPRMNFCEEVWRYKALKSKQGRLEKLVAIGKDFLGYQSQPKTFTETTAESTGGGPEEHQPPSSTSTTMHQPPYYQWSLPRRTEIEETTLCRSSPLSSPSSDTMPAVVVEVDDEMLRTSCDFPIKSESCIGLKGVIRQEILRVVEEGTASLRWKSKDNMMEENNSQYHKAQSLHFAPPPAAAAQLGKPSSFSSSPTTTTTTTAGFLSRSESTSRVTTPLTSSYPEAMTTNLFDKAEAVTMESLKRTYWDKFVESPEWLRCRHLLWYQDRPVIADDFFIMRVLGRGGFGLVNGTSFFLVCRISLMLRDEPWYCGLSHPIVSAFFVCSVQERNVRETLCDEGHE
jgi:hypothetical protein